MIALGLLACNGLEMDKGLFTYRHFGKPMQKKLNIGMP